MTKLLRRGIHGCDWFTVLGEADLVRHLRSEAVQAVKRPSTEAEGACFDVFDCRSFSLSGRVLQNRSYFFSMSWNSSFLNFNYIFQRNELFPTR
jgi:hypothetical protein